VKRAVLAVLLAFLLVAQPVVAQQSGGSKIETRQAELAVETPPDIDKARSSSQEGTPLYQAEAGPLDLHPQNFDRGAVVDFGVTGGNGRLGYQSEFGQYRFAADAAGTYQVFWIVSETIATDNGSQETVQVRYEAFVRVGVSDSVTMSASDLERLRADASQWQEFNATLDELMAYGSFYAPEPQSRGELIDKMSRSYRNQHAVHKQLGGDISEIIWLLALTMGGWILFGIAALYHLGAVGRLWRRLNRFRSSESVEGEVSDRILDLDKKEREFTLENSDLQDVEGISAREAAAFRDAIDGVSLRDAKEHLDDTVFNPTALLLDRLHVMGAAGYAADVTARDGGDGFDVEILDPEAVDSNKAAPTVATVDDWDDGVLVDLESMDEAVGACVLNAMETWDPDPVREFEMAATDVEPGDVDADLETMDLEAIQDGLNVGDDRFEDRASFGQLLRQLTEHVRRHPYTDGDGATNSARATCERLLKISGTLADKHHVPDAEWQRQHVERALLDHDPGERTERTIRDIKRGREVSSD